MKHANTNTEKENTMKNATNAIAAASENSAESKDSQGIRIPDSVASANLKNASRVYALAFRRFIKNQKLDFVAPAYRWIVAKAYHEAAGFNRKKFGPEARAAVLATR